MMYHQKGRQGLIGSRPLAGFIYSAGDYVAILAAEWAALFLRNAFMDYSVYHIPPVYFYLITPLVFMAFLLKNKLYSKKMPFYQIVENIFYACLYGVAFSIILMFLGRVSDQVSRLYVALFGVLVFLFLVAVRYVMKKTMGKSALMTTSILIVGAGRTADAVVTEFRKDTGLNYTIVGFLEDHEPKTDYVKDYPILGGFGDMEKVVKETGVQSILIAAPGLSQDKLSDLIYRAQSICPDVGIVPNLVAVPMSNIEAESYYDAKVMVIHIKNNLQKRYNRIIKYTMGWICALAGLIVISPFLAYIGYRIHQSSPGPIFYKGERVGERGKLFKCYKFRSMYVNSDDILKKYLKEQRLR